MTQSVMHMHTGSECNFKHVTHQCSNVSFVLDFKTFGTRWVAPVFHCLLSLPAESICINTSEVTAQCLYLLTSNFLPQEGVSTTQKQMR